MKQAFSRHNLARGGLLLSAALVGFAAGAVAILYRYALLGAEWLWGALSVWAKSQGAAGVAAWFGLLAALAVAVWRLLATEPLIAGSGIPQFEGEVIGALDPPWWRVLVCKLVGGALCVLGGLSLGREGPSVQLGAMAGKGISTLSPILQEHCQMLISCGAGAGLAAAFNAPLAGVLFALEEVHKSFSPPMMTSLLIATTAADCLSKLFFGVDTVFSFPTQAPIPIMSYGLVALLGILTGLAGAFYNGVTMRTLRTLDRFPQLPRLLLAFFVSGAVGFVLPQIMGGGHRMIELLYEGDLLLGAILALLVLKFLFSQLCFGVGAPGGIFFPLLVLGAYLGGGFSRLTAVLPGGDAALFNNFVILGMLGLFVAIVRAPITGIVLIVEMTGTLAHLPSLTLVAALALGTASLLGSQPIYDSLLERILKKQRQPAAREG